MFNNKQRYSKIAIKFLKFLEKKRGIIIQKAGNGDGEKKIGPYYVDGFYNKNRVIEYNGCLVHGCPMCFATNAVSPITGNYLMGVSHTVQLISAKKIWVLVTLSATF